MEFLNKFFNMDNLYKKNNGNYYQLILFLIFMIKFGSRKCYSYLLQIKIILKFKEKI